MNNWIEIEYRYPPLGKSSTHRRLWGTTWERPYRHKLYHGFEAGLLTELLRKEKIKKVRKNVISVHPSFARHVAKKLEHLGLLWYVGPPRRFRPKAHLLLLISREYQVTSTFHDCLLYVKSKRPYWKCSLLRTYDLALLRTDVRKYVMLSQLETESCMQCHHKDSQYYADQRSPPLEPSKLRPLTRHDRERWKLPSIRNPILLLQVLSEKRPLYQPLLNDIVAECDDEEFEVRLVQALKIVSEVVTKHERIPDYATSVLTKSMGSLDKLWHKYGLNSPYPNVVRKDLDLLLKTISGGIGRDPQWRKEVLTRCSHIAFELMDYLEEKEIPGSFILEWDTSDPLFRRYLKSLPEYP